MKGGLFCLEGGTSPPFMCIKTKTSITLSFSISTHFLYIPYFLLSFTSPAIHTTTDKLTMQAPQSNSPVLTNEDTIGELQKLKGVMNAKYAEWDTKATNPGSKSLNS
jgi:hypothetical protein